MAGERMSIISIIMVILLLLFAGFLAGSESAINSISRIYVEQIAEKESRGSAIVQKVVGDPARFLNVTLFVRKACELTATVIVADGFRKYFDSPTTALLVSIALMLVLSYVVVGVGPRTLGKQKAGSWIVPASLTSYFLSKTLGPLTSILIAIGNAITPGKGFKTGPFEIGRAHVCTPVT